MRAFGGHVTPGSDNARRQPGVEGQGRTNASDSASVRAFIKRVIVMAACRGFPAAWAHRLIELGGLRNA